jgi:hypothetical protein
LPWVIVWNFLPWSRFQYVALMALNVGKVSASVN